MIVAGFGFRSGANVLALCSAYQLARENAPPITHLATLADKADGLAELANLLSLPVIAIAPEHLVGVHTMTASAASQVARGLGSVAEACALAALREHQPRLLTRRQISRDRMATCAIAQGALP
ncbi:cobalt-precorrin 5A hydrolase [Novosphingobium sp. PhB165]|uniref:cobalamin biosynthesis protein n=1 Tax=Novosphingobium sp. PhB165 TaxID=2485105 RepID=UPI001048E31F|nr:cobalamin biosynthesis protein [Novosphingobium sp. PhB165]TCM16135.1 cobalt-precorrin 5A hydrolase [Novosphingobium sp. PhB165]